MSVLKRHSDKTEARPAKRRSDAFSDTEAMSESKSESEYEEGRSNSRGYRNGATSIGRRLVKRRRAGRWEATPQSQVSPRAVTPPSTSPLEESLEIEGKVSEEEEEYDYSQSPTPPSNVLLKWKNMPYPGLPQVGYAFSYASGPICFMKVVGPASKSLAAHWHAPKNYVAYVIYSLHPSPERDNKRQGLEMVNELAAHGFIDGDDCEVNEETVQAMRALSFQKGNVVVSLPKLGDEKTFQGYWPGSTVDGGDRKMILNRLQSVMHDRALPPQRAKSIASPNSAKCSDESRLRGTTLTASENEEASSGSSGRDTSLEDTGLIKFVKVHWRQSKWIADNVHLIRSTQHSHLRAPTNSDDAWEEDDKFKAVIVWSNKRERREGINLLERIIAARLGGSSKDYMKDAMLCQEVMENGEVWVVFHKKDVVVGFPGFEGEDEFLEGVQSMEQVWR